MYNISMLMVPDSVQTDGTRLFHAWAKNSNVCFQQFGSGTNPGKEVRKMAEKLITRAKNDSVHNRREVAKAVYDEAVVNKLFKEIAPMFAERQGGYTRILKTGNRLGDAAEMVILELVEKTKKEEKAEKKDAKKAKADN